MERTTIQVKSDLLESLDGVKRELGVASYDAAIRQLIQEHQRPAKSLFGAFRKLPEFKRDEIDRLD